MNTSLCSQVLSCGNTLNETGLAMAMVMAMAMEMEMEMEMEMATYLVTIARTLNQTKHILAGMHSKRAP